MGENSKIMLVDRLCVAAEADAENGALMAEAAREIESLQGLLDQAGVTVAAASKAGLPPLPWDWQASMSASANGAFHCYLVDAKSKKIGVIWGTKDTKALTADTILKLVNQHA